MKARVTIGDRFVYLAFALFLSALALTVWGGRGNSHRFMTTVPELQEALEGQEAYPLAIRSGKFFASGVRIDLVCMTPLEGRPGFYDRHLDTGACPALVWVLDEDSRSQPR